MHPTLFEKIISGEIPSHKIYEDEYVYAFLDIFPISPGHTLVVPKKVQEFVWDLDDENYIHLMKAAQKIAQLLKTKLKTPYVGEQIIGVDVPHAHVHLIPFHSPDEFHRIPDQSQEPDHEALAALAQQIVG